MWITARECVSCHHQGLGMIALAAVREHGLPIDEQALADQVVAVKADLDETERLVTGIGTFNGQIGNAYRGVALATVGEPTGRWSDLTAHYLAGKQAEDGSIRSESHRPPLEDSPLTATAWSLRALRMFAPRGRSAEIAERVRRATAWLEGATAHDTEDRASQLLGLTWAGVAADVTAPLARVLLAEQRDDGGWAQMPTRASDAYATGQTLAALHVSGHLAVDTPAYQRGLAFLLRTQERDGSWHVVTRRKTPGLPHFETGFPHGVDQFISFAGTAWAVTALALAYDRPGTDALLATARPGPARERDLLDIVLFGSVDELRAALARGDAVTNEVVFAAATRDPARLGLVLEHGGSADAMTSGNAGLLAVAAGYSGAGANVDWLLAHGAIVDAEDEAGVTALARAAASGGDVRTLRVLLEAGASPNIRAKGFEGATPMSWAFAVADQRKLELLVERGATLRGLHAYHEPLVVTAVIDRNLELLELVLKHGALVDERSAEGLTALHWAATVDSGGTAFAERLLRAGADPRATTPGGLTARTLAVRHGNRSVEKLLRTQEAASAPAAAR